MLVAAHVGHHRGVLVRFSLTLLLLLATPTVVQPAPASAQTRVVIITDDTGPGALRNTIAMASAGDTITFDTSLSGGTIQLASVLLVDENLTIDGSGLATPITISGAGGGVQAFQVAAGVTATLRGLRIANGTAASHGGGIHNSGTLTLEDCTIADNQASFTGGGVYNAGTLTVNACVFSANASGYHGGAIHNATGASLTVVDSTFSSNVAADQRYGGAIANQGNIDVSRCTFVGNSAGWYGGAIYNYDSVTSASVTSSSFSGNAASMGGGVMNHGSMVLTHCTLLENSVSSADQGAGVHNATGAYLQMYSTVIANSTAGHDFDNDGTLTANQNNLVEDGSCSAVLIGDPMLGPLADNGGSTQTFAPLPGSPVINAGGSGPCLTATDQRGVTRPQGTACDIGAYEMEVAAVTTGAASDVGATGATLNGTVNARGWSTAVQFQWGETTSYGQVATATPGTLSGTSAEAVSTAVVVSYGPGVTYHYRVVAQNDVGTAYGLDCTFTTPCAADITVSNTADDGAGSLRRAVQGICAGGTVRFSEALAGQTITLASTLVLNTNVTIDASALASPVTISKTLSQVLRVPAGVSATLKGLTIANGGNSAFGGGVGNEGTLEAVDCTFTNNRAVDGGGLGNSGTATLIRCTFSNNLGYEGAGVKNDGTMTMTRCTFTGNEADMDGGGVLVGAAGTLNVADSAFSGNTGYDGAAIRNAGSLTLSSSTFSGNEARHSGGALHTSVSAQVTNCTLSGNRATLEGGGIRNVGTLWVTNCTLSGNSAGADGNTTAGGGLHNSGTLHLANSILAGSTSGGDLRVGWELPTNSHNLVEDGSGTPSLSGDPLLGPLANNGGSTQTLALQAGSPAVNAGYAALCPATDQRGVARPQGAVCDVGAYEQEVPTATTLAATGVATGSATLQGMVNDRGCAVTVTFQYGLTTAYGSTVPATPATIVQGTDTDISATLSGLLPGTTYHYCVVATNDAGTTLGQDATFTTSPGPTPTATPAGPHPAVYVPLTWR